MDPRVLQAAERVLAFARAQVIAGLSARLAQDSEGPPDDDTDTDTDDDTDEDEDEDDEATARRGAPVAFAEDAPFGN